MLTVGKVNNPGAPNTSELSLLYPSNEKISSFKYIALADFPILNIKVP
jgi:hypothetical protein